MYFGQLLPSRCSITFAVWNLFRSAVSAQTASPSSHKPSSHASSTKHTSASSRRCIKVTPAAKARSPSRQYQSASRNTPVEEPQSGASGKSSTSAWAEKLPSISSTKLSHIQPMLPQVKTSTEEQLPVLAPAPTPAPANSAPAVATAAASTAKPAMEETDDVPAIETTVFSASKPAQRKTFSFGPAIRDEAKTAARVDTRWRKSAPDEVDEPAVGQQCNAPAPRAPLWH